MLSEQEELSLDSHQVSEELVDPDLAVGLDRTQRQGNATGADLESVPGTTSQALSCLQHFCFVRRKRRQVAAPATLEASSALFATARVDSFFVPRNMILEHW